jgi:HK97 family phage major capsid protein
MAPELKELIEQQGNAFAEYKATLEAKIEALKKDNGTAELDGKIKNILTDYDAMKDRVDKVHADLQQVKIGTGGTQNHEDPKVKAHKEAFNAYCRKNDASKYVNVVQSGVDAEGGFACPPELSNMVAKTIVNGNPIRLLASKQTTQRGAYQILQDPNDMVASRTGEMIARAETNNPQIGLTTIIPGEMYCYPRTTQAALDDGIWDFESWLVEKASRAFNNLEITEHAAGNGGGPGINAARGITDYPTVLDANWAWGSIGRIHTGQAATIGTTGAELVNCMGALEDEYKTNAAWIMNRATLTSYRLLRAGANAANMFLFWQPSLQPGMPDTLLGFPVYTSAGMPVQNNNTHIVAFGDIGAAYTVVDRVGMNIIRDNITMPGFVRFHVYRRSSGAVVNFQAVKLIRCAA